MDLPGVPQSGTDIIDGSDPWLARIINANMSFDILPVSSYTLPLLHPYVLLPLP